jgi:cell division protein FtsB
MATQRRAPSGQGPARRPGSGASRVRTTSATKVQPRRAARPALSRRTVNINRGATNRTVATRPRALTGRATVLIVVFVALALAYTYPLRVYLAQESQIAQLEADQAAQRTAINAKSQELQKWKDPEYLRAQAREKLFYVRPGEIPLLVLNDPAGAAQEAGKNTPAAAPDRWYDTLWSSVQAADAEPQNCSWKHLHPPTSTSWRPSWAAFPAAPGRSPIAARAAIPTSSRPRPGCPTARPSRRCST